MEAVYYPFGGEYSLTEMRREDNIGYSGKPLDEEIGLFYFGARYYDPQVGRFTSIDPAKVTAQNYYSFNRYSYVNNNPYKYVDPDGEFPFLIPIAIFIAKEVATELASRATGGATDFLSFRRMGTKAAKSVVKAAKGGDKLFRRGERDSSKLLKNQAKAAEESKIGIHGVSVSSSSATSKAGQVVRCATCKDIESAGFKVHKTGRDPNHFTVELPKPVTKEVSKRFNDVFK